MKARSTPFRSTARREGEEKGKKSGSAEKFFAAMLFRHTHARPRASAIFFCFPHFRKANMGSWPVDAPHEHSWGPSSSHVGEESDWEDDAVERRQLQSSSSKPSAPLPPSAGTSTSSPSSSSAPIAPPIASLDDGALHHVLGFLDPASLSAAGATSRRLRELVSDPLSDRELWKVRV